MSALCVILMWILAGDPRGLQQIQSKRSPVLQNQLTWGPCSPDDGLNWTLIHGATSIDLHPQGMLKPCASINLTKQMAETEASAKMPGSAAKSKPGIAKGFLLQPGHGVKTRRAAALQTKSSAKAVKQEAMAAIPVPLPSERDVLWCSFNATHGHVVFASPPATAHGQVRWSQMVAVCMDVYLSANSCLRPILRAITGALQGINCSLQFLLLTSGTKLMHREVLDCPHAPQLMQLIATVLLCHCSCPAGCYAFAAVLLGCSIYLPLKSSLTGHGPYLKAADRLRSQLSFKCASRFSPSRLDHELAKNTKSK